MNFDRLSEVDIEIIGQGLHAAADGPFFPDGEFHTLFGLDRSEVRKIAEEWPKCSASAEDVTTAVNNSLNNLLGYPHSEDAVWPQWISIGSEQLKEWYKRLPGRDDERYLDLLA